MLAPRHFAQALLATLMTLLLTLALPAAAQNLPPPPPPPGGTPLPELPISVPPRLCYPGCYADPAAYQIANQCTIGQACGLQVFSPQTQCCGRDPSTGEPMVRERTVQHIDRAGLDFGAYVRSCPDMRQSDAAPDANWPACQVGQPHGAGEEYAIIEVRDNGTARPFCIDGCSTPERGVDHICERPVGRIPSCDRNNISGHPDGGFLSACTEHDVCYQTCSATHTQQYCDDQFLANMSQACNRIPADLQMLWEINPVTGETHRSVRDQCLYWADSMHEVLRGGFLGLPMFSGQPAFNLRKQQYCQCC